MTANGAEEEGTQFRDETSRSPARGRRQILLKAAGFVVWGSFVLYCLGFATSRGLCCADDSYRALVAKNIVTGIGFATIWGSPVGVPQPKPFDPDITAGPVLIIPCALLLKVAGMNEVVPGVTAILLWGSILTVLLVRVSQHTNGSSFLFGVSIFCLTILAAYPLHFEHWFAFLGEIPAVAFLLLGHWLLAAEKLSWRTLLLAGLALGLAVQTKYLALLGTAGACVILLVRFRSERLTPKTWLRLGAIFSMGCVIPTLAFEIFKLFQLGLPGYFHNWREFLGIYGGFIIKRREISLLALVSERLAVMRGRFFVDLGTFITLIALIFCLARARLRGKWFLLFGGLLVSVSVLGLYWLVYSAGWPRYLVIAAALGCFALAVPIFGLLESRQKVLLAILTCVLLTGGIPRIRHLANACDRGLFRASSDRAARAEIVRRITELKREGPVLLGGLWWAAYVDVEFGLDGSANFNRIDAISSLPGRKIILIDRRFSNEKDEVIQQARAKSSATLFSAGSYDLLEITESF